MNTFMDWDLFEKVELTRSEYKRKEKMVFVSKDRRRISITKDIVQEAGMNVGDRYDLYRLGKTFALKKANAGLLKISKNNGVFSICSTSAGREVYALNGNCQKNEAWVEAGVIFFKPMKEGE